MKLSPEALSGRMTHAAPGVRPGRTGFPFCAQRRRLSAQSSRAPSSLRFAVLQYILTICRGLQFGNLFEERETKTAPVLRKDGGGILLSRGSTPYFYSLGRVTAPAGRAFDPPAPGRISPAFPRKALPASGAFSLSKSAPVTSPVLSISAENLQMLPLVYTRNPQK